MSGIRLQRLAAVRRWVRRLGVARPGLGRADCGARAGRRGGRPSSVTGVRCGVVRAGGRPTFSGRDEAIAHYLTKGAARHLSPHPLLAPTTADETTRAAIAVAVAVSLPDEDGRWLLPHPGWDIEAYLRREPKAHDHPYGPFGHLVERLSDSTELDVFGLAGPTRIRWGEADGWRGVALTWTAERRLRLPPYSASRPDDIALPDLPQVEPTPESLISVVIPTWNRSSLLQRAIVSLRAQTWSHWEALVVDDGSEDDTREVVAALAAEDPRIRLIARPHEGVCQARNAGLAEARGGFIAFLDSDNEWLPALPGDDGAGDGGPQHRRGVRNVDGDDQRRSALSRQPGDA